MPENSTLDVDDMFDSDQPIERSSRFCGLLSLSLLRLSLPSRQTPLTRLPRHSGHISTRPDGSHYSPTTPPIIHPTTSSVPAWTTRPLISSLPRTPMLTTHWKARLKRYAACSSKDCRLGVGTSFGGWVLGGGSL
jgi:hypothetical protein